MIKDLLTKKITRDILDKFLLKNSSEKLTLDLGCSGSPYSKYFKNRIGFDIKEGVGVDVVGDAHNLPFEDSKFDIVLCTEVLEHLHTPQLAISEMKRVLKSGGKLILTTRFIFPIHDAPHDYYRYTKYGLKHLFKDWEVLSLEEEVNTINTLSVLLQRIGYQTQLKMNSLSKVFIFLLSKIVTLFSFLIKKEYEDIERSVEESYIMTSGYYIVCKKK
jgi:ubiquinone/menaquinone biosynthesis C-methylase UbiE